MNRFALRLALWSVKAAQILIPILYRLVEFLVYAAIILFILFVVVILL